MRRASKISKSVFFKFDVITLEHGVSSFADDNFHDWVVSFEIDMQQKTGSFIRNVSLKLKKLNNGFLICLDLL